MKLDAVSKQDQVGPEVVSGTSPEVKLAANQENEADAQGIDFLTQLEQRHTRVLEELDQLNHRIEQVIDGYQQGRRAAAGPAAAGPEPQAA